MFVDYTKVELSAGKGGSGCISFRREKYIPKGDWNLWEYYNEHKYVMLNVDSNSTEKICKLLPGADSPTIIPLQKDNKVAIHALCKEPVFWETMENLKSNGASSILVMPVEKILN